MKPAHFLRIFNLNSLKNACDFWFSERKRWSLTFWNFSCQNSGQKSRCHQNSSEIPSEFCSELQFKLRSENHLLFSQCTDVRLLVSFPVDYYGSNKSTGKETGKMHLCAMACLEKKCWYISLVHVSHFYTFSCKWQPT